MRSTGTGTFRERRHLTLDFVLVRHIAKEEAPLAELRQLNVITTIAEVTSSTAATRSATRSNVTGTFSVNFANYGDPS